MTPPVPLLPEEKLAAIIQKQIDGGYNGWKYQMKNGKLDEYDSSEPQYVGFHDASHHILEILLDPEGLKAAYNTTPWSGGGFYSSDRTFDFRVASNGQRSRHAAHEILELWLSGGPEAAIEVAFSLLPS